MNLGFQVFLKASLLSDSFVGPGLGGAGRWAGHFGGQPIHIPKVSQDPLKFDPPAFQFVVGALCSAPPRVVRALPILSRAQEVKLADSVL